MIAVLGVDGGQSGVRLRHSALDRVIELDGISRLGGDTIAVVAGVVVEGWQRGRFPPVERVVLGLTTAPIDESGGDRLCRLVAVGTGAPEVWLADDAVTAHAGALSGCAGISLVAGTGVACLAAPDGGEPRVIGGHGYLLGDEGGAFWIGREGLRAALHAAEGRAARTALVALAERRYGEVSTIPVRLHDSRAPVDVIAQFARDVLEAAESDDPVAGRILDDAAVELLSVVHAGATWVGGAGIALALGGRMLEEGGGLRRRLDELLAQDDTMLAARSADASPLEGAVRLGLAAELGRYRGFVYTWAAGAPA